MPLALAAIALAGALILTACGASLDPVAKAASKAISKGSEHVAISGTVTVDGQASSLTGAGDFQGDPKRGAAHLTVGTAGRKLALDEVLDGSMLYMKSPLFTTKLPSGKQWLSLDLVQASKLGINFSAFAQASPTDTLQALRKAGTVTKVGDESLGGVPVTHYRASVDYSHVGQGASLKGAPIDVWIDNDNLLRRMKMRYSSNAAGSKLSAAMTMDLSKFGEPVNVQVPRADETIDMTKLGG